METVQMDADFSSVDVVRSSQPEMESDTTTSTSNTVTTSTPPSDNPPEVAEPFFESDLLEARKELQTIAAYLNVLVMAHNNAEGTDVVKFQKLVNRIGTKLMTTLAYYRQTARDLAIRYRTAQEEHQLAISTPSPEYADLERLKTEFEQAKVAAKHIVTQDYSVFNDLNLVSLDDLTKSRPEIFADMYKCSTAEQHHRTFLAQIEHEHERRKRVMSEIESLTKKKRVLQDDVRKRKDVSAAVNRDIDDVRKCFNTLAEKLNTTPSELDKDASGMGVPLLAAFHASSRLPERRVEVIPVEPIEPAEPEVADVEMVEGVVETPVLTPELSSGSAEPAEDVVDVVDVVKEEGEASEEENEEIQQQAVQ